LDLGITKIRRNNKKISVGALSGIKSPPRMGREEFFPCNGEWGGDGGGGKEVSGDGNDDYAPRPQPAPLPSLVTIVEV